MFNNPAAFQTAKPPQVENRSFYELERICQDPKLIGNTPYRSTEKSVFLVLLPFPAGAHESVGDSGVSYRAEPESCQREFIEK